MNAYLFYRKELINTHEEYTNEVKLCDICKFAKSQHVVKIMTPKNTRVTFFCSYDFYTMQSPNSLLDPFFYQSQGKISDIYIN